MKASRYQWPQDAAKKKSDKSKVANVVAENSKKKREILDVSAQLGFGGPVLPAAFDDDVPEVKNKALCDLALRSPLLAYGIEDAQPGSFALFTFPLIL